MCLGRFRNLWYDHTTVGSIGNPLPMWSVSVGGCQNYVAKMATDARTSSEFFRFHENVLRFSLLIGAFGPFLRLSPMERRLILGVQVKISKRISGSISVESRSVREMDHPEHRKDAKSNISLERTFCVRQEKVQTRRRVHGACHCNWPTASLEAGPIPCSVNEADPL
jgi:hypothetical protein